MAKRSVVTAPQRKVTVDGEVYELVVCIGALRAVCDAYGGLKPAAERVQNIDYEAVAAVIAAGARLKLRPAEAEAFLETVWAAENKVEISGVVLEYLVDLLNGPGPSERDHPPPAENSEGNA